MHAIQRCDSIDFKERRRRATSILHFFQKGEREHWIPQCPASTLVKTLGERPMFPGRTPRLPHARPRPRDSIAVFAHRAGDLPPLFCSLLLLPRIAKMAKRALQTIAATLRVKERTWLASAHVMALGADRWHFCRAQRQVSLRVPRGRFRAGEAARVLWQWQGFGELHAHSRRSLRQRPLYLRRRSIRPRQLHVGMGQWRKLWQRARELWSLGIRKRVKQSNRNVVFEPLRILRTLFAPKCALGSNQVRGSLLRFDDVLEARRQTNSACWARLRLALLKELSQRCGTQDVEANKRVLDKDGCGVLHLGQLCAVYAPRGRVIVLRKSSARRRIYRRRWLGLRHISAILAIARQASCGSTARIRSRAGITRTLDRSANTFDRVEEQRRCGLNCRCRHGLMFGSWKFCKEAQSYQWRT